MAKGGYARKILRALLMTLAAAFMVAVYFWLYLEVFGFELPKTAMLKKTNAAWQARSEVFNRRLDACEHALEGIEDRDNGVYRSIYGMTAISDEMRLASINNPKYDSLVAAGVSRRFVNMLVRVDELTKRSYVQSKSLDELGQISKRAGDMISCIPSVPPILPKNGNYRISSRFGYRVDPVRGGGEFHQGVDFALKRGNPIYAPGDGYVEKAEVKFTGYGTEIVIDHGFGYKTRYAHLHTLEVAPGMKVRRGELIGTVGSSGRSTGDHLHYEVLYKNARVNPLNYMDLTMPLDEYYSMVNMRKTESPNGKRLSTSELLKKRN